MTQHVHAKLMAKYAEDAMSSETPWENWEVYCSNGTWEKLDTHPCWIVGFKYRPRVKTVEINNFHVVAPMSEEPKTGTQYFYPNIISKRLYVEELYMGSVNDILKLRRGLCFKTAEDAIAMAKAMLRIDPEK